MTQPSVCGRTPPAVLQRTWNETRAVREHEITFVHGHPPFQMRLRPSIYDEDNWSSLIREREYTYHVALLRMVVRSLDAGTDCVAVDVGANSGYVSLAAASLGCKVTSFEANPWTARLAQRSFDLNGALGRRITMHNLAVARQPGSVTFMIRQPDCSIYDQLISDATAASGVPDDFRVVRVPSKPLHSILGEPSVVHMVKLDCEGCEGMALETMAPLLTRGAIKVILSEWITPRILKVSGKASLNAAVRALERGGYGCYSWSGHPQPLSTLVNPKTEVGDLFLVHRSVTFFQSRMQRERSGMLATWQLLKTCNDAGARGSTTLS